MLRPARFDAMRTHLIWILALAPCGLGAAQQAPPPIADNSFLLEEAYNQEAGVVQHISAFQRSLRSAPWTYTFTQEYDILEFNLGETFELDFNDEWFAVPPGTPHGQTPKLGVLHPSLMRRAKAAFDAAAGTGRP